MSIVHFMCRFLRFRFRARFYFSRFPLARLQVEGMPFDISNNVFLNHLTLEAFQRTLHGFTFAELDFNQTRHSLSCVRGEPRHACPIRLETGGRCERRFSIEACSSAERVFAYCSMSLSANTADSTVARLSSRCRHNSGSS